MIYGEIKSLEGFSVHIVGNSALGDALIISNSTPDFGEDIKGYLVDYFLPPFQTDERRISNLR